MSSFTCLSTATWRNKTYTFTTFGFYTSQTKGMQLIGLAKIWQTTESVKHIWNSNTGFSKFYNPPEYLAVDDVIFFFKGRIVFKEYIPRTHKSYGIKIYKLCDSIGYTYDMKMYSGKDEQFTEQHLTAPHAIVTELTRKAGRGHKLYMDNFFSSPTYMMMIQRKKLIVVGLSYHVQRACHRT